MLKKLTVILLIMTLLPIEVFAYELIDKTGTAVTVEPYYDSSNDVYMSEFDPDPVAYVWYGAYTDSTFSELISFKEAFETSGGFVGTHRWTCNSFYKGEYYDEDMNLISTLKFHATAIEDPACESVIPEGGTENEDEAGGSGGGETGGTCDSCAVFECPGWGDFMGGLEDIKEAIPPAPDWEVVSDVFRDSIAPQIKSDMAEILGEAPPPPAPPEAPDVPNLPSPLDDRDLSPPEGKEAPGLEESTFNENDIKNEAEEIEVRDDPTGGFTLPDDPIGTLPSQEEFKDNAPEEGTAPLPGDPKELENIAPIPNEDTGQAPMPEETTDTAPTPSEDTGTAPIPGASNESAPIPGASNETAPIP